VHELLPACRTGQNETLLVANLISTLDESSAAVTLLAASLSQSWAWKPSSQHWDQQMLLQGSYPCKGACISRSLI